MSTLRLTGARLVGAGAETHRGDLTIEDGLISAGNVGEPDQIIDVEGSWISPGFIDLHTHVFPAAPGLGIDADDVGIRQGVTTIVDAGSSGRRDLPRFLDEVVAPHDTRVLAWLNIADQGLVDGRHELADLAAVNARATAETIGAHPDLLVGIKARMSSSVVRDNGTRPLALAIDAAQCAGVPVMIHTGNEPPRMIDCADLLRAGDVITHAFHGKPGGLLDGTELRPRIKAALDRGVRLDVGHGESSFSADVLRGALHNGIAPYSTSTDIHHGNVDGVVGSLARTMTKVLACGLDLDQVIRTVTEAPATVICRPELGTLIPGTPADLTIFDVFSTRRHLSDADGESLNVREEIAPRYCMRDGVIHDCR